MAPFRYETALIIFAIYLPYTSSQVLMAGAPCPPGGGNFCPGALLH